MQLCGCTTHLLILRSNICLVGKSIRIFYTSINQISFLFWTGLLTKNENTIKVFFKGMCSLYLTKIKESKDRADRDTTLM